MKITKDNTKNIIVGFLIFVLIIMSFILKLRDKEKNYRDSPDPIYQERASMGGY